MYSQENTEKCALCNGTEFYTESGFYFCSKCQTQNENIREEVLEERYDTTTRLRKTKIRSEKSEKTDIIGWTSWELYNFVLIGLVNELIQVGASPNIKLTVLQLWTMYLTRLEVAFTSKTKKNVPKMARRYHKRDAEIIYGKINQKKKRKKKMQLSNTSASSMISSFQSDKSTSNRDIRKSKKLLVASEYNKYLQSQGSSDNDGLSSINQSLYSLKSSLSQSSSIAVRIRFNKKAKLEAKKVKMLSKKVPRVKRMKFNQTYVTSQYVLGPEVLTPAKLWSLLYLALRINNQDIYLSDMLRFSREGHLSYYKLDHLVPSEIRLTRSEINLLTQNKDITHKGLRKSTAAIAKFLSISELPKPDLLSLIKRYCEDLRLPRGILLYTERLFCSCPSVMKFTSKSPSIPNYEGRAIAYIIVVLKTLFSLDDVTEQAISRLIEKINRLTGEKAIQSSKLFSFCEWQEYIECRKSVLSNLHFSSKLKYDPESVDLPHLYLRFMGLMKSKQEAEPPEFHNSKQFLSQNLISALHQCIDRLNDHLLPMKETELFSPSYTPLSSYINELLEKPHYELPSILATNFYEQKVGYTTTPELLIELASQCGIKLDVIDHSIQYFEKIVPPFEQRRMPTVKELNQSIKVQTSTCTIKKTENLLDYSHRNRICKLKMNFDKFKNYCLVYNKTPELNESLDFEEDSGFNLRFPDGSLNLDIDLEDETCLDQSTIVETKWTDNSCLLNKEFCKNYNINLYNHEIESLLYNKNSIKNKYIRVRDSQGKFVKVTSRNIRESNKRFRKKEAEKNVTDLSTELSENETQLKSEYKKTKVKDIKNIVENQANEDPDLHFDLPESDISILENDNSIDKINKKNISIDDNEIFLRPYRDYWMYHCIFSRVKGKNFDLFEKELPKTFLWLLNECANIAEMTNEDLYEEVCLIEGCLLNILKLQKSVDDSDYKFHDCKSKSYSKNILNKW